MDIPGKNVQKNLPRIKKNVEESHRYFKKNFDRFNMFRTVVFRSSISDDERNNLTEIERPELECNILESMISRLRGEFANQEPSVMAHRMDKTVPAQTVEIVAGHNRAILRDSNNNSFDNETILETMSGGFSVIKVWTQYKSDDSFEQEIKMGKVRNPTLCGFDPMAQYPHKADGAYAWECIPMRKADFKERYPKANLDGMGFTRSIAGTLTWSYKNEQDEILLICDYYEKKSKKVKILYCADNKTYTDKQYKELCEKYSAATIAQPPQVIMERMSKETIICLYRFIDNQILEYKETSFHELPYIFVDGNSIMLTEGITSGRVTQFTRPYVYHALGLQRLKNIAMQVFANEIEMMPPNKFLIAQEALPTQSEFLEGWLEPQKNKTLIYKSQSDDESGRPLPPPVPVQRVPLPPEVSQAFMTIDRMAQNVLGTYMNVEPSGGMNPAQLSGKAIIEGVAHSNASAMPYIINYLAALNHAMNFITDLLPTYMVTPRTIPVITTQGKRDFVDINQPSSPVHFGYKKNALKIYVEPGVNFEAQKEKSLQMITSLIPVVPALGELFNSRGLPILLKNVDIRNSEELIDMAEQMMKEQAQQRAQMQAQQQNGQANNPLMIKLQLEQQKLAQQNDHKQMEMQVEAQKLQNERLKMALSEVQNKREADIQTAKMITENHAKATELAMKHVDQEHGHAKDLVDTLHKLTTKGNNNETTRRKI